MPPRDADPPASDDSFATSHDAEFVAEVSQRGLVPIPQELRDDLGIDASDLVTLVRTETGEILLRPVESATDLCGVLADTTDEEDRAALELLRASRSAESDPAIKK